MVVCMYRRLYIYIYSRKCSVVAVVSCFNYFVITAAPVCKLIIKRFWTSITFVTFSGRDDEYKCWTTTTTQSPSQNNPKGRRGGDEGEGGAKGR